MQRALHVSALPRFACKVQGRKVDITSEGAPQLTVDLGQDGLGLRGKVVVTWNGKQVWSGTVTPDMKPLELGGDQARN